MRLNIGLCRHCTRSKDECEYRNDLKQKVAEIKHPGTLNHTCPIYRTLTPTVSRWDDEGRELSREKIIEEARKVGARVRVRLKQLNYWESGGTYEPPEPNYEWIEAGEALGSIVSAPHSSKPFFVVLLDKAVILSLPNPGASWDTVQEREIEHRCLPANKLIFVDPMAEGQIEQGE